MGIMSSAYKALRTINTAKAIVGGPRTAANRLLRVDAYKLTASALRRITK